MPSITPGFLPVALTLGLLAGNSTGRAAPVPGEVVAGEKYEAAMIAAIHLFAEQGEAEHLRAVLARHPKLVNERQRFPHPRKPFASDAYTPLHRAAAAGRAATVTLLLLNGADPAADGGGGWTALHLAARGGHLDAVKALVEHRADPGAKTVARAERVEISPSSPPGAEPVRFPAVPALTPLDVAVEFKRADVANYLRSVKK